MEAYQETVLRAYLRTLQSSLTDERISDHGVEALFDQSIDLAVRAGRSDIGQGLANLQVAWRNKRVPERAHVTI